VPNISAGLATTIALIPLPTSCDTLALSPSTRVLLLPQDLQLPSLLFLLFFICLSFSLSGDLKTFLACGVGTFSSSSESSKSSLVLFRIHLELDKLAWISKLKAMSDIVSGLADTVCDWAFAVGGEWRWEVGGSG